MLWWLVYECSEREGRDSSLQHIKKLHPDVYIESHRLYLVSLRFRATMEQLLPRVIQHKDNGELVYGLAHDHLPHGYLDDRRAPGLWCVLE